MTMLYNPKTHARHSVRLPEYDYASAGYYFITICTQDRKCLFGRIRHGEMELNKIGKAASDIWKRTEYIREHVYIDSYIVMPDHLHGIIQITDSQKGVGAGPCPAPGRGNAGSEGINPTDESFPFQQNADHLNHRNIQKGVGAGPCPAPGRGNAGSEGINSTDESFPFLNGFYDEPGAGQGPAPTPRSYVGSVPAMIGSFKSESTKTINHIRGTNGIRIWQRNFNDRIIRDQEELEYYRTYIRDNPKRWGWRSIK